jgi:hypothetical protein
MSTFVPIFTTMRSAAATCARGESSVRWDLAVPMAFLLGRFIRQSVRRKPEWLSANAPGRDQNGLIGILPAPQ